MNRNLLYIGIAIILLLLVSTTGALIYNSKNKKYLNAEKLRNESILSEKLMVEKELEKIKNELSGLKIRLADTEKSLSDTRTAMGEKEKRIALLSRDNNNYSKIRKELDDLKKTKTALESEYSGLKSEFENLTARNRDLQNSMSLLETQNNDLNANLQQAGMYNTDNFVTYGSRGKKDNMTFYAFRTKKMNLNFEVPQSLTDAISFIINTPDGKTITPDDKALSWTVNQDPQYFTASLSAVSGEFESSRQVTLKYESKEKLTAGEYKIQIFSNNRNIGNCRMKLK